MPPTDAETAGYDAQPDSGQVPFTVRFEEETEIVGYPKAHLWVEADGYDDMDLFVLLEKLDASGARLEQVNVPNDGPAIQAITTNGASILKYKGSDGRLRASMRHLDDVATSDDVPVHTFDRVEKLAPGEFVPLDIDMFPVCLAFHAGQQLRLTVSGFNSLGGVMPRQGTVTPDNRGRHVIHTGGSDASYLQLPLRRVSSGDRS